MDANRPGMAAGGYFGGLGGGSITSRAIQPLLDSDPRQIGPYQIRGRLGQGAMGHVYLAFAPTGPAYALKVLRPDFASDSDFRRRFAREIAAARAVHSPFVNAVTDADPDAQTPWLASYFIPGPPLNTAVNLSGPFSPRSVAHLGVGIGLALQAIHTAGVVHRDLKPGNVLIASDGPRVIDFGIARAADASMLTSTGMRLGTPSFMAPEQVSGSNVGAAVDVWAIGGMLVYAATGRTPFGDGNAMAILYRVENHEPDLDGMEPALAEIASRCLEKDPKDRPSPAKLVELCRAALYGGMPGIPVLPGVDSTGWLPAAISRDLAARAVELASVRQMQVGIPVNGPAAGGPGAQQAPTGKPAKGPRLSRKEKAAQAQAQAAAMMAPGAAQIPQQMPPQAPRGYGQQPQGYGQPQGQMPPNAYQQPPQGAPTLPQNGPAPQGQGAGWLQAQPSVGAPGAFAPTTPPTLPTPPQNVAPDKPTTPDESPAVKTVPILESEPSETNDAKKLDGVENEAQAEAAADGVKQSAFVGLPASEEEPEPIAPWLAVQAAKASAQSESIDGLTPVPTPSREASSGPAPRAPWDQPVLDTDADAGTNADDTDDAADEAEQPMFSTLGPGLLQARPTSAKLDAQRIEDAEHIGGFEGESGESDGSEDDGEPIGSLLESSFPASAFKKDEPEESDEEPAHAVQDAKPAPEQASKAASDPEPEDVLDGTGEATVMTPLSKFAAPNLADQPTIVTPPRVPNQQHQQHQRPQQPQQSYAPAPPQMGSPYQFQPGQQGQPGQQAPQLPSYNRAYGAPQPPVDDDEGFNPLPAKRMAILAGVLVVAIGGAAAIGLAAAKNPKTSPAAQGPTSTSDHPSSATPSTTSPPTSPPTSAATSIPVNQLPGRAAGSVGARDVVIAGLYGAAAKRDFNMVCSIQTVSAEQQAAKDAGWNGSGDASPFCQAYYQQHWGTIDPAYLKSIHVTKTVPGRDASHMTIYVNDPDPQGKTNNRSFPVTWNGTRWVLGM